MQKEGISGLISTVKGAADLLGNRMLGSNWATCLRKRAQGLKAADSTLLKFLHAVCRLAVGSDHSGMRNKRQSSWRGREKYNLTRKQLLWLILRKKAWQRQHNDMLSKLFGYLRSSLFGTGEHDISLKIPSLLRYKTAQCLPCHWRLLISWRNRLLFHTWL